MKKHWLLVVAALALSGNGESISEDMREAYRLMEEARTAARADRNQEAATLFADLIKNYPSLRGDLLREYADQLLFTGRAPEAVPLLRETLSQPGLSDLDRRRTLRSLALSLLWSNRFEEAVSAYRNALRVMPDDADLTRNYILALVGAAREAARADRNKQSAEWFGEAIDLAPDRRRELLREYADQLTFSGHPDKAVPLFREVLKSPDLSTDKDLAARRNLALALLWSGQHGAAIAAYDDAIARVPDDTGLRKGRVDAIIASAREAASRDQNALAARRFRQAIRAAPDRRMELLREYADQLTFSGNPAAAVNLYRELITAELMARGKPSIGLLKALGLAHLWAGQHAAAKDAYEQALTLDAGDEDAKRNLAEALVGMARTAASENRKRGGRRPLQRGDRQGARAARRLGQRICRPAYVLGQGGAGRSHLRATAGQPGTGPG